jgi:uncharacterized protein DUF4304
MSDRNAVQQAFDAFGRAAGAEKKSGAWYRRSDEVISISELQKSQYGPSYYFNQAFYLRQLGDEPYPKEHKSHIRTRLEDLLPDEEERIERLLDLEYEMPDDQRAEELERLLVDELLPLIERGSSLDGLRSMMEGGLFDAAAITGPAQRVLRRG